MKSMFIVLCLIGIAVAFPADAEVKAQPELLKSEFNNFGDKGYNFAWDYLIDYHILEII